VSASSPMQSIHRGRYIKLYRAEKGIHAYPGIHLWMGSKIGHVRLWPLKRVRG
jgi:hypothetical protein